jgi:5-methyltetrahydropteroyltriglutamate--homocysteine methyltransferase
MKRNTDRILVAHQGTLPRPDALRDMLSARSSGQPYDMAALAERIQFAVREAAQKQVEYGIDIVNDSEMSKTSFSDYVSDRLGEISGPGRRSAAGESTPLALGTPRAIPFEGKTRRQGR